MIALSIGCTYFASIAFTLSLILLKRLAILSVILLYKRLAGLGVFATCSIPMSNVLFWGSPAAAASTIGDAGITGGGISAEVAG